MSNSSLRIALKTFPSVTIVNPLEEAFGTSLVLGGSNREHVSDLVKRLAAHVESLDVVLTKSKAEEFSDFGSTSTRLIVCKRTQNITLEGLDASGLRASYDNIFLVVNNIYGVGYTNFYDICRELFPSAKCFIFNVACQFFVLDEVYLNFLNSFTYGLQLSAVPGVQETQKSTQLRLLVDASMVTATGRTGIENYTLRMVETLAVVPELRLHALCQNAEIFQAFGIECIFFDSSFGPKDYYDRLRRVIEVFQIDLFISPYRAIPSGLGIKSVLVVHDVIPMIFPDFFETTAVRDYFDTSIRSTCKFVDLVICDSDSTKRDVERVFGVSSERIRTVYPGPGALLTGSHERPLNHSDIQPGQFILYTGTLEPRKGVEHLVHAFIRLRNEFDRLGLRAPSLVLAGKFGWKCDRIRELLTNSFHEGVVHLGYVTDAELLYLYKNARVLAYPSTYEGFGLPLLEAFACGLPAITFQNSSLSEIGGDAAYFAKTQDADGLYQALSLLLRSPIELERMSARGLQRAKLFSWERYKKDFCSLLSDLFPTHIIG